MEIKWSPLAESNCRPTPYHGVALPTELSGLKNDGKAIFLSCTKCLAFRTAGKVHKDFGVYLY